MDAPQQFRTAINGFRREDVVRYLEYLNAKHTTELNQFTADADALREENAALKAQLESGAQAPENSGELEDLKARLDAAAEEKKALEQTIQDLKAQAPAKPQDAEDVRRENLALKDRCAQLEAQIKDMEAQKSQDNLADRELEAYRRAERAERVANEKADLIYHRANAILDETSGKIEGASSDLSKIAEQINAQLQQMQYSINSSKLALKSAVDTMHALRVDKD